MRRTAAVASIMFALGFLGARLARPPAPVEEASPPVREAPHAAVPAVAAAPAEDASPETSEDLRARIEELLAAVPPAVPGTGVVTGRVTTRDGTPLPGARVRAEPAGEDERGEGDVSIAAVLDLIARHRRSREATADAEGAFTLTGLEDCTYEVSAELPGYEVHSIGGHASVSVKSGDTIQLIGTRCFEVPVVLVLPDGTMPTEGSVTSGNRPADAPTSWKPPRTSLFLPRGDYDIKGFARHAGKTYESGVRVIEILEGKDVPEVVLALEHKLTIRGLVRVPDPWLGARPWAKLWKPGSSDARARTKTIRRDDQRGRVDDGGVFAFTGLDPGTYVVQAGRFWRGGGIEKVVELAEKDVTLRLDLPPVGPEDYTVVRVLGPDGAPLPSDSCTVWWSGPTTLQRDGTWWLLHANETQSQRASLSVRVEAKNYGERTAFFGREVREVVVQFAEPAALEITWDAENADLARASVEDLRFDVILRGAQGLHEIEECYEELDARRGRARFFPISPGRYNVGVSAVVRGFSTAMTICPIEIDLRPGENRCELPLAGLSTLRIAADPALRGKEILIRSVGVDPPVGGRREIGDDGIAVFPLLRAGEYRLCVRSSSPEGDMGVTLPGPSEVRFEPRPADGLLVLDTEGIEATGLRQGDCIIGVAGVSTTTARALYGAILSARSRETARIIVMRGEARMELDVDPDAIASEDRFWPASMRSR